jgi:hypothetical protein
MGAAGGLGRGQVAGKTGRIAYAAMYDPGLLLPRSFG